jgi:hypothetical protein
MDTIISAAKTLDGVSDVFDIDGETTFIALGLEDTDQVTFWIVLLTDPLQPSCVCPPIAPVGTQVLDEIQHTCCGTPIVLTRERYYYIHDAPIGVKMRVKLENSSLLTTQKVFKMRTSTMNITSQMRGCPCEETP